jgi:soluble P-type ATPase
MLEIHIPGYRELHLQYIVSDYNGTLAFDGVLIPKTIPLIRKLSEHLEIHVVTADTFGDAEESLSGLPVTLAILPPGEQDKEKREYVEKLGANRVVSLGNGRNDKLMLREAALGICLLQAEGASVEALVTADVVCHSAMEALELLLNPKRLIATLRS